MIYGQDFHEMHARLRGPKTKPYFLSLADEIAEPRPDMNIKVAACTVSEKYINVLVDCVLLRVSVKFQILNETGDI